MSNFREVTNDILKEWFGYREDTYFCNTNEQDKKYQINLEEIGDRILKNVSKQSQKYVKSQLELLDKNFFDYITYWNEKYYRNGFCDGIEIIINNRVENK